MGELAAFQLRLITPEEAVVVEVPRSLQGRRRSRRDLRALPPGTQVALCSNSVASRRRTRRLAKAGDVVLEREFLAIPSLRRPLVVVQDRVRPVNFLCSRFATVPPGARRSAAALSAALRVVDVVLPWSLVGAMVPGRVSIGTRT